MNSEDTKAESIFSAQSGIKPEIVIKPIEQVYNNLAKVTYVFQGRVLEVENPDIVSINWKLKTDEIEKDGERFVINWENVQFIELIFKR